MKMTWAWLKEHAGAAFIVLAIAFLWSLNGSLGRVEPKVDANGTAIARLEAKVDANTAAIIRLEAKIEANAEAIARNAAAIAQLTGQYAEPVRQHPTAAAIGGESQGS